MIEWWARGDLNPYSSHARGGVLGCEDKGFGSGGNEELTTQAPAPSRPRVDNRLLEGFRGWLRGRVSDETAEYYVGVVERGEWPPRKGKHVKAWR